MARPHGGKGGAEPRARILARRQRAWELSVRGWTQRQIAEDLHVSQSAVHKILKRAAGDIVVELRSAGRSYLMRLFARTDQIYREASEAWDKSKSDRTRRRHQRIETGTAHENAAGGAKTVAEAVATTREGDPRFLTIALHAGKEQREVLLQLEEPSPARTPQTGEDPWAPLHRTLETLTTEELVLLLKIGDIRILSGPPTHDPRPSTTAITEALAVRRRRGVAAAAAAPPTCAEGTRDEAPIESAPGKEDEQKAPES
jgi:predicted transcriptional regulator